MTWVNTVFVLAAAYLAVFGEAAFQGVRHLLGAQVDVLPALVVYAALRTGLNTVCLVSFLGGLWFDSLSANPLGISVLPLFVIGLGVYLSREVLLREQAFAQFIVGVGASAAAPFLTLVLLLSTGHKPLLGWGTLWQWVVMTAGGAALTPLCFDFFDWLNRTLIHSRHSELSFRPDREIRRGR